MIYQNMYWFDILPRNYDATQQITGKWLYWDETAVLHNLLKDIDNLVESGDLRSAKIARKLPGIDPFPDKSCVLCVFTSDDKEEKERVRNLLREKFGFEVEIWKSDAQTQMDWNEDGWLRIQFEIGEIQRKIKSGEIDNLDHAQQQIVALTKRLEQSIRSINNPDQLSEININLLQRARADIEKSIGNKNESTGAIIDRISNLEKHIAAISANLTPTKGKIGEAHEKGEYGLIFVIMPFAKRHIDTYDTIKRAVKAVDNDLPVERIDERAGAIEITDELHKTIHSANLIICDLSEERPNVYYELGYARGLSKPLICIAREGTTIHFDVYGLKTIFFENYRELEELLSKEIAKLLA